MTRSRDQCDAEARGEPEVAPVETLDSPWEPDDLGPPEADPWNAIEEPPPWDPVPASAPESEGVDVLPAPSRSFAVRRSWPIQLIRSHPFALVVAVCFVAAALLMLSTRPSRQAQSNRPVRASHASRTEAHAGTDRPGGKRKRNSRRSSAGA